MSAFRKTFMEQNGLSCVDVPLTVYWLCWQWYIHCESKKPPAFYLLGVLRGEPKTFLGRIVARDENWVQHFDMETIPQRMIWEHSYLQHKVIDSCNVDIFIQQLVHRLCRRRRQKPSLKQSCGSSLVGRLLHTVTTSSQRCMLRGWSWKLSLRSSWLMAWMRRSWRWCGRSVQLLTEWMQSNQPSVVSCILMLFLYLCPPPQRSVAEGVVVLSCLPACVCPCIRVCILKHC